MPTSRNKKQEKSAGTFEESLAGLEEIVAAMENEELPLEDLVACYEKGSALLGRCETLLKGARERIELITLRNEDARNGGGTSGESAESGDEEEAENDDIRLF